MRMADDGGVRGRWAALTHQRVLVIGAAALLLGIGVIISQSGLLFRRDLVWEQIQRSKVWRVGMDPSFPPFEMEDGATHQISGYDADLAQAIAAQWGVRVELKPTGFDSLFDAIWAGQLDAAISALPANPRFTRDLGFSRPYFEAGLVLVVPAKSAIRSQDDLAKQRVAVEWGSTGDGLARSFRTHLDGLIIQPYADAVASLDGLSQDKADAAISDAVSVKTYLAAHPGAGLHVLDPPLQSEGYVIVSPIQAFTLQLKIGTALTSLEADGTLARLEAEWFQAAPP